MVKSNPGAAFDANVLKCMLETISLCDRYQGYIVKKNMHMESTSVSPVFDILIYERNIAGTFSGKLDLMWIEGQWRIQNAILTKPEFRDHLTFLHNNIKPQSTEEDLRELLFSLLHDQKGSLTTAQKQYFCIAVILNHANRLIDFIHENNHDLVEKEANRLYEAIQNNAGILSQLQLSSRSSFGLFAPKKVTFLEEVDQIFRKYKFDQLVHQVNERNDLTSN